MKKDKGTKKKLALTKETLNNIQKEVLEDLQGGVQKDSTGGPGHCSGCLL